MPDVYKAYKRSKVFNDTRKKDAMKTLISSNDGLVFLGMDKIVIMQPEDGDLTRFKEV